MIDLLGNFLIVLSILSGLMFIYFNVLSFRKNNLKYHVWENTSVIIQQSSVIFVFVLLLATVTFDMFLTNYAASYTSFFLPLIYRVSSAWSDHQGSFLLWVFEISLWGLAFVYFHKRDKAINYKLVLAHIVLLQVLFMIYVLFASNPYSLAMPIKQGGGMNPLLHHPGLVIHPPILFFGYAGFSIVACIAMAGLLSKNAVNYLYALRFWTALSLTILTIGIVLGAWWAYQVLGWGGWWFWDPVENAALLPWLSGLALLHLTNVAIKQSKAVKATFLIAMLTFTFTLFATFLVRSGLLISVHAFALTPLNSKFFLVLFIGILFYALLLYMIKSPKSTTAFHMTLDKSSLLLFNVCILLLLLAIIILALFYPLILEVFTGQKISIGAPYYIKTFVPIALLLVYCCSYEPFLSWKLDIKNKTVLIWFVFSIVLTVISFFYSYVIIACGLLLLIASFKKVVDFLVKRNKVNVAALIAHVGLAFFVIMVGIQVRYSSEQNIELVQNKTVIVQGDKLRYIAPKILNKTGYMVEKFQIEISNKDQNFTLYPEIRTYESNGTIISHPAIKSMLSKDFYIVVTQNESDKVILVRVYKKILMWGIWFAALISALGILIITIRTPYKR